MRRNTNQSSSQAKESSQPIDNKLASITMANRCWSKNNEQLHSFLVSEVSINYRDLFRALSSYDISDMKINELHWKSSLQQQYYVKGSRFALVSTWNVRRHMGRHRCQRVATAAMAMRQLHHGSQVVVEEGEEGGEVVLVWVRVAQAVPLPGVDLNAEQFSSPIGMGSWIIWYTVSLSSERLKSILAGV